MTTTAAPPHPLPKPMSRGWFIASIVLISLGIVVAAAPGAGIPFLILALVHLILLRRRAVQAHKAWEAGRNRSDWIEFEAQRLGAMDHLQRKEELHGLGVQIENSQKLLETERVNSQRALEAELHTRRQSLEAETEASWKALKAEQANSRESLDRELRIRREAFEADRTRTQESLNRKKDDLRDTIAEIQKHKVDAKHFGEQALNLKDVYDVQDYGLYDFENPADDSVQLGETLKQVQQAIKDMVKNKTAASGSTTMTLDGNLRKGQKMVGDMIKLLLRSFNAEAENAIKTVRAGHLTTAKKRLEKSAAAVERLGTGMNIRVASQYLSLRKRELELTHKHLEAVKAAKEEEREVRRREREEATAQREFLEAKAKQVKEAEHYRNVVAALQASGDDVEAAKMTLVLQEVEEKLEDVERTMANTRAGYVYVASNRGAFGERIVKIGMTRRLNPDERLKELSDASVPFNFDKHTMIFTEDAVGLENALHKHFADVRVNLVNMRREYFYATPAEVKDALTTHQVQVLEYHEQAEAVEFEASEQRRSQSMR